VEAPQERGRAAGVQTRLLPRGAVPPTRQGARDEKAIVAVAHSIVVIAYHVLRDGQS